MAGEQPLTCQPSVPVDNRREQVHEIHPVRGAEGRGDADVNQSDSEPFIRLTSPSVVALEPSDENIACACKEAKKEMKTIQ
jgi:hypothetical protein